MIWYSKFVLNSSDECSETTGDAIDRVGGVSPCLGFCASHSFRRSLSRPDAAHPAAPRAVSEMDGGAADTRQK